MSRLGELLMKLMTTIVGPTLLMLLGAVIALTLFGAEEAKSRDRAIPTHLGRTFVEDESEIVHFAVKFRPNENNRRLVVHGGDGKPLVNLHVFQDGALAIGPHDPGTSRFSLHRRANGSVNLGLNTDQKGMTLLTQDDGSADFFVELDGEKPKPIAHVNSAGDVSSPETTGVGCDDRSGLHR